MPLKAGRIVMDNGNLLSNGFGLCVATQRLVEKNAEAGRGEADTTRMLHKTLGARELVVLEPLADEPLGHVDMFATFTGPDTIVVAEYSEAYDSTKR